MATRWPWRHIATIAFEIVEQYGLAVPDLVAVPTGLGDGLQGIWRGFKAMADWGVVDSLPRMVAVETGGALASALAGGKDWVVPSPDANGAARSLSGVTGTVQGLNAVVESEGLVVRVTEGELEAARVAIGETEGIWVDLAGAAGIAAIQKLASRGDVPARVQAVAVVTEHGLLDDSSVAPGALDVVDARVDDLLPRAGRAGSSQSARMRLTELTADLQALREDIAEELLAINRYEDQLLAVRRGRQGGREPDRRRQEGPRRPAARAAPATRRQAARVDRPRSQAEGPRYARSPSVRL